ncbi:MAG: hypothetical protein LJU34_08905 [Oscillospiraceae bacterium]|nr:hypothetical protein [Oscillospiraceae bacterium]
MKQYRITLLSASILLLSFVLCRFVFFDLHGMRDWPAVLLIAGGVILGVSVLFRSRYLPLFAALGYPLSFAVGVIFQYDYADPAGGMTLNSMWIIWTAAYAILLCIGAVIEIIARRARGRRSL